MRSYKHGSLRSGSIRPVESRRQAVAIAMRLAEQQSQAQPSRAEQVIALLRADKPELAQRIAPGEPKRSQLEMWPPARDKSS